MRAAWLVALACAHRAPPRNEVDVGRVKALVADAERALATDLPFDLRRPFEQPALHAHAGELYLMACRAGDAPSCWLALELGALEAEALVDAGCNAGQRMSCRARDQRETGIGVEAVPRLRKSCDDGFPLACRDLIEYLPDGDEHDRAFARALELSRDGCAQGILEECQWTQDDDLVVIRRPCELAVRECDTLGYRYFQAGDVERARAMLERACQYGTSSPESVCIALGHLYVTKQLAEPAPGRGRALLAWACPRLARKIGPMEMQKIDDCR